MFLLANLLASTEETKPKTRQHALIFPQA